MGELTAIVTPVWNMFSSVQILGVSWIVWLVLPFFIGIIISYLYATPTGASVVMINIFVFVLFWLGNILRSSTLTRKLKEVSNA